MTNLLSLIPWPWRIAIAAALLLCIGGAYGVGAWQGYDHGYKTADAQGRAALASLQSSHDQAYAQAMAEFTKKLQAQTAEALKAEAALAVAKVTHEKERAALRSRIAKITAGSSHAFSAAFVRLYNEAIGAGGDSVPAAGDSPGADGAPGAGQAPGAGVLAGRVSEADLLAHIADYGKQCRNLKAQVNAWIDLAETWK